MEGGYKLPQYSLAHQASTADLCSPRGTVTATTRRADHIPREGLETNHLYSLRAMVSFSRLSPAPGNHDENVSCSLVGGDLFQPARGAGITRINKTGLSKGKQRDEHQETFSNSEISQRGMCAGGCCAGSRLTVQLSEVRYEHRALPPLEVALV